MLRVLEKPHHRYIIAEKYTLQLPEQNLAKAVREASSVST